MFYINQIEMAIINDIAERYTGIIHDDDSIISERNDLMNELNLNIYQANYIMIDVLGFREPEEIKKLYTVSEELVESFYQDFIKGVNLDE